MSVPYAFADATTNLPGSQLDANFAYLLALISAIPVAPTLTLVVTENIAASSLVNIYKSGSDFVVRNANGALGYAANGYVLSSYTTSQTATVFTAGEVTGVAGLTSGGPVYLSATPGAATQIPPAGGSGDYWQQLGFAVSSSAFVFQASPMSGPL